MRSEVINPYTEERMIYNTRIRGRGLENDPYIGRKIKVINGIYVEGIKESSTIEYNGQVGVVIDILSGRQLLKVKFDDGAVRKVVTPSSDNYSVFNEEAEWYEESTPNTVDSLSDNEIHEGDLVRITGSKEQLTSFGIRMIDGRYPNWRNNNYRVETVFNNTGKNIFTLLGIDYTFKREHLTKVSVSTLIPKHINTKVVDKMPHFKGFKDTIFQCIVNSPENLPLLKSNTENRKYYDKVINEILPYKVGIEIECNRSLKLNLLGTQGYGTDGNKKILEILGGADYSDDGNSGNGFTEHRLCFNGHKQVISLNRLCALLSEHCELAINGAIHYHFDCPEIGIQSSVAKNMHEVLTKRLDDFNAICNYRGRYNRKEVGIDQKSTWVNIRRQLKTIEIRIAAPKFDYKEIILEIIALSQIITDFRKEMGFAKYKL